MTIDERLDRLVGRHEREMEEIRKEGAATRAEVRRAFRLLSRRPATSGGTAATHSTPPLPIQLNSAHNRACTFP